MFLRFAFLPLAAVASGIGFKNNFYKVEDGETFITANPQQWTDVGILPTWYGTEEGYSGVMAYYDHVYESFSGSIPMTWMNQYSDITDDQSSLSSFDAEASKIAATRNMSNAGNPAGASAFGGLAVGAMGAVVGILML
ncbi:hypothetical protein DICA1_B15104 [Diutina catenulata]